MEEDDDQRNQNQPEEKSKAQQKSKSVPPSQRTGKDKSKENVTEQAKASRNSTHVPMPAYTAPHKPTRKRTAQKASPTCRAASPPPPAKNNHVPTTEGSHTRAKAKHYGLCVEAFTVEESREVNRDFQQDSQGLFAERSDYGMYEQEADITDRYYIPVADIMPGAKSSEDLPSIRMCCVIDNSMEPADPEAYYAIKGPKKADQAYRSAEWKDALCAEVDNFTDNKKLLPITKEFRDILLQQGVSECRMQLVYEEKMKDGKLVRKVRMVVGGHRQDVHGETFSQTPHKWQWLTMEDLSGKLGLHCIAIDQKRGYLQKENKMALLVRPPTGMPLSLMSPFYIANRALYGMKDAGRDHALATEADIIDRHGFTQLVTAPCFYTKRADSPEDYPASPFPKLNQTQADYLIIMRQVDDIISYTNRIEYASKFIEEYREHTECTDPEHPPKKILGCDREEIQLTGSVSKLILLRQSQSIEKIAEGCLSAEELAKTVEIPMNTQDAIIDFTDMEDAGVPAAIKLTPSQHETYMQVVGQILYIAFIRMDATYAIMYLTWFTRAPRRHHLKVLKQLLRYFYHTRDLPLVLGGLDPLQPVTYTDGSLGTGTQRRSITGKSSHMGAGSGSVRATSSSQHSARLSSFDMEMDCGCEGVKDAKMIKNFTDELDIETPLPAALNDNDAMINFVNGVGNLRGARHIEMRLHFLRHSIRDGEATLEMVSGIDNRADTLTKPLGPELFIKHRATLMGLHILPANHPARRFLPPQHT